MLAVFRPALLLFTFLTVVTGVLYPLLVTLVAQLAFSHAANGSVVLRDGKPVGSELIGQPFTSANYFWSRPSATAPTPYNAAASAGSNLGPTNEVFLTTVKERVAAMRAAHPRQTGPVPADLVTASASGLDPHISRAGADYQVERVAAARGLAVEVVRDLVAEQAEHRLAGVLGEPRLNVLKLNLALEEVSKR